MSLVTERDSMDHLLDTCILSKLLVCFTEPKHYYSERLTAQGKEVRLYTSNGNFTNRF